MSNRNYDFKKRMNAIHNRNKAYLRKTAAIAATTLIISFPVSNTLSAFNVPGFETQYVSAADFTEISLLTNTTISATQPNADGTFDVTVSGQSVADISVLGDSKSGVFHVDVADGSTVTAKSANVSVQILPVTIPEGSPLYNTVDGITGPVVDVTQGLVNTVDNLLNRKITIPGIPLFTQTTEVGLGTLLKVEGLTELNNALDRVNNLSASLDNLTDYQDTVNVTQDPTTGAFIADFNDGLGNHLETAVKDLIQGALDDLNDAINGLTIELLPDDELQQVLTDLIPGVGGVLGTVIGTVKGLVVNPILNPALDQILSLTGTATDAITNATDQLTDASLDLVSYLLSAQVLGQTSVTLNNVNVQAVQACDINGGQAEEGDTVDVDVKGAIVGDKALALQLIGNFDATTQVTVPVIDNPDCESGNDGGNDGSGGNDGNDGSGNDGNDGSGNDGNDGSGNDGNDGSGNDGNDGSGNDGNDGSGNDGNDGSGNDGNDGSGNDGNDGSGNDGNDGSGNDGNDGSGNDGNDGSGNDGNDGSGNDGNDGSGNDGNDGNDGSGNDGNDGSGNDGNDGSGNDGNDGSGNDGNDGSGNDGNDGSGNDGNDGSDSGQATTDGDGKELPKTATNTFNWLMGGFLALIAGFTGLFSRRKEEDSTK